MKISFQKNIPINNFVDFNDSSFSGRSMSSQKLVRFRYFNPLHPGNFIEKNVIAHDDDNQISGQALYHPANYYFEKKLHTMEWGFDLFVDPNKRTDSVGLHLLEFIKANKDEPIFASGVGEKALRIEKFFGYHIIGHLKKYYKLVNPFFLFSGFLRAENIKSSKFPFQIVSGNTIFEKVNIHSLWDAKDPYNTQLLEFERNVEFMKWRFYSEGFHYAVYQNIEKNQSGKPSYFVVRTVKIKRITSLVLVDYRYDTSKEEDFMSLLTATQKVALKLMLPVIVTGSSLQVTDSILDFLKFKITGKDRPIICNIKDYKQYKDKIQNRNFIFSTLADSDGEYLM
ncbi:hypothetical protein [Flavobacterium sp. CAN_S2]|uniref:hypothetical protein n=1 Tax=Flavobacterium sp. CAN_S2 TaxID=2787726 RepID=UPI0018CA5199